MSNASVTRPLLPLMTGIVYAGTGYPFVSGAFFTMVFGTESQREWNTLKRRFGKSVAAGFFEHGDAFFEWVLREDPSAKMFHETYAMLPPEPHPDPAVDLPAFVAALHGTGMKDGAFDAGCLFDRLLTPAVHERANAFLDRTYGAGSGEAFERVFDAVVVDAAKTS